MGRQGIIDVGGGISVIGSSLNASICIWAKPEGFLTSRSKVSLLLVVSLICKLLTPCSTSLTAVSFLLLNYTQLLSLPSRTS
jgi:hypothetical protein